MMTRSIAILGALLGLVLCVVLTSRWVQARTRAGHLAAELETLRHRVAEDDGRAAGPAAPVPAAAPVGTRPTDDSELEARKALLADARAIPELARREAALVAVRRIKAQHESSPPPPRALPPPFGAKYGAIFTELLGDPHYLALVREDWQAGVGSARMQRLDRLDVPDATKRQVLDIEFDTYLANAELATYIAVDERQAAMQERTRIQKENQARLQQLLGEEGLQRYAAPSALPPAGVSTPADMNTRSEAPAMMARSQVESGPLAVRLSYSESPLTEADGKRLETLLEAMATPTTPVYRLWYDMEFFRQAQAILNPMQLAALRQLQEESEARTLRSRLPKSSELPRTTRRARLEGEDKTP